MKALVTGGAGFIGSHICEQLLKDDYEVICLDNFDSYYDPVIKRRNIAPFLLDTNFTLIEGDIRDPVSLKIVLEGVDYVFHEAAQAGVRISVMDPIKTHVVNTTGTLNLLCAARDSGVNKIINASSSSVYGKVEYLPFDEKHPKQPISPYGVSKLMAEEYCRVFQELYGMNIVSLRYFTVYGPRMRPDLAINIFMKQAFLNKPLQIFGDGTKTRDITFIDDVVKANILAMTRGNGSYNIGGGHMISILELAERIIEITGSSSQIEYEGDVPGDAEHTSANTAKAHGELGWTPGTILEEGLRRYAEWLLNYK